MKQIVFYQCSIT